MTRHKHADLMIAFANNSSLAVEWYNKMTRQWEPCYVSPGWFQDTEYRIKPKKGDFICEIDGVKWYLGPEASDPMTWADAKSWCEEQGCELPPRELLLMCHTKEDIRKQFKENHFWSSTEYVLNPVGYAWTQAFSYGSQLYNPKGSTYYVRGVFREEVK